MRSLLLAAACTAVILWVSAPASPWEFDEILFLQSLQRFDPLAHHPPPPGYPLLAGFGRLLRPWFPGDFFEMVTISFVASVIGFVLLARGFGALLADSRTGVTGALLFYLSPVMLVHSTLALSEPGALALLAAGLAARSAELSAAFLALSVGWRPQFALFVVPLLITQVVLMRGWRSRTAALGVFTLVCLAWLVPLASAVGGVERLLHFEVSQASYVSSHDADVSRSGWTPALLAARFIAHPWGTKLTSLPLLILAGWGAYGLRREQRVLPLAVASLLYVGLALTVMDPADGARYAIPFVLGTSFFAAVGASRLESRARLPAHTSAVLLAVASIIYVSSLISQRASTWSPPVQAAFAARRIFPAGAVALYELPLWPHAQYYLSDRHPMRVNEGLEVFFDRPDVPMFLFADGVSRAPEARVFRWQPSDAYSKLTRNHYRLVSVIPLPPWQRFRVLEGIYAPEREIDGQEWRWFDSPAGLQLPHGPPRTLILRLGLPRLYPEEGNTLRISVEQEPWRIVPLLRGREVTLEIPVPAGAPVVRFQTARTFIPAGVPGSLNRDARRLAFKLYALRTR